MEESDQSILHHEVLQFYDKGEFPTTKEMVTEMKEATGFDKSEMSMLWILKFTGLSTDTAMMKRSH
jgi:hypothetical protein